MTQQFHFWNLSEETRNTNSKEYMYPKSIAVLFAIVKIWKYPSVRQVMRG